MSDSLTISAPEAVTLDWLLGPAADLAADELVSATVIALCTDRRARDDDRLPHQDDDNRRGWWGDTDAVEMFDGWTIGSRLWLLERAKITGAGAKDGSLLARVETYCREALKPFQDQGVVTRIAVSAARIDVERVDVAVTLYRGNLPAIALRFQDLWRAFGG